MEQPLGQDGTASGTGWDSLWDRMGQSLGQDGTASGTGPVASLPLCTGEGRRCGLLQWRDGLASGSPSWASVDLDLRSLGHLRASVCPANMAELQAGLLQPICSNSRSK